ncbi:MAG: hypothetical protein Q9160_000154 [Pyrenula sp. 1 TL-2023]
MSFNTNTDIWLAGAFAAFTVDLLVYPLDTLKTRIQSPSYQSLYRKPQSAGGGVSPALFRGLYQGLASVILVTIPSSGAFFTTYEALKYGLNELTPPNSTIFVPQAAVHSVASGGAELVSCAILTPAEVLKQNAQIVVRDKSQKGGRGGNRKSPTWEVLKQFRRQPTKLMTGYTALAARNLPFTGLQFPLFEQLKSYFIARRGRRKEAAGLDGRVDGIFERARITAMSAGIAGTAAAWITTPIDVVKTRIMLRAGEEAGCDNGNGNGKTSSSGTGKESKGQSPSQSSKPTGFQVGASILRTEGLRGIFRGALLRSAWTALGSGLYLGCYEGGRFWLEEQRRKDEGDADRDFVMEKKGKTPVKVGVGASRSQGEKIGKSAWQD